MVIKNKSRPFVRPQIIYNPDFTNSYPHVESIIIEFGFMDNASDFKMLTDRVWQDKLTAAVAEAVRKYIPVQTATKTEIMGKALLLPGQLKKALKGQNPGAAASIVDTYYKICEIYGIKADLAFLQAVHETNWFKFTGIVKPEQNNFAGLGAIDENNPGLSFPTVEAGIKAHIQHLYAYCTC